jgi:methylase of polypeptide subunit release factors
LREGVAALGLTPPDDRPIAALSRLFIGGETLPAAVAEQAFAPLSPAQLPGLVRSRNGSVLPRVRIEPFEGLLVASDPPHPLKRDHVLGVGTATRMLAGLTVRRRVEEALDLCTGSGSLALLAARHADRVVATDLSRRALRFARLNAELNESEGVEWLHGDLFEPLGDARFDLVTANPPFVVSPSTEFTYRDGGYEDDALTRGVVGGVAARLREGGYATVVCNWISPLDGGWSARPRGWLAESGCDALILRHTTESARAYALRWNLQPGKTLQQSAAAAQAWAEYYRERGIESLTTGVIVLRKRSGANWMRDEELAGMPVGSASDQIERIFAAVDLLAGDVDLRTLALRPAPGTTLVERRRPGGEVERARLSIDEGMRLFGRMPVSCVAVLDALDGTHTVAEAIEAADATEGECLPALLDLLGRGLLIPE